MVEDSDILNYWGDALIKFSREILADKAIPDSASRFLQTVGLPSKSDMFVNFQTTDTRIVKFQDQLYLILGDDYGTNIGMNMASGEIFSIPDQGNLPIRFINSTIKSFVIFLQLYTEAASEIKKGTEEEIKTTANSLREKFIDIDNRALANGENWWSLITEEMNHGML